MQTLAQLQSGELKGSKSLKLSCGLTSFPQEIFELADTLELLDLSTNKLSFLPDNFGQLKKLKIAFFSENLFTELPQVLADCPELEMIGFKANQISYISEETFTPQLRWLILTNNRLGTLPKSIGKCLRLQKCALAGNRLKALPEEMSNCRNLELLRISANQLTELPSWLFSLPRLSWLAFSGNPCSHTIPLTSDLQEIAFEELQLKEQLGEGASGIISKAIWKNGESKDVAVKIFKGEVTSDGLPDDEMNACITAGLHPNLIKVLGKVHSHPQQKQGLVLELIPPVFKNLGNPPNYQTCSRDTYPAGTAFSLKETINIAAGIASVTAHLHEQGIMHGDLYAHNTLIDNEANALLGDFGAASAYDRNSAFAPSIERIEVRAFGCLLDDLLNHLNEADSATSNALRKLQVDCMNENVMSRPNFGAITKQMDSYLV